MEPINLAGYLDALGKVQKLYGKSLEPICKKWALTRNEMDVLLFLYNNPQFDRAADIVSRRGIAKSHVSLSVSTLERRGMLQREFSPKDRRTAHLALTERGKEAALEGRRTQERFFTEVCGEIPPEELRQWQNTASKLRDNIEKMEPEAR